jgi:hypothetical protein
MTKKHIAPRIDDNTQITGTSAGHVRSNWNAGDGYARELEVERARLAAIAAEQKRQEEQMPMNLRLAALEGEVMRLKAALKELKDVAS